MANHEIEIESVSRVFVSAEVARTEAVDRELLPIVESGKREFETAQ